MTNLQTSASGRRRVPDASRVDSERPALSKPSVGFDLAIREPAPMEVSRARYLFREVPLPPCAAFLVAERVNPLSRFVAALAWWSAGQRMHFRMVHVPGVQPEVCFPLIHELERLARSRSSGILQYAEPLNASDPRRMLLENERFHIAATERLFKAPIRQATQRSRELFHLARARVPSAWKTESIRTVSVDAVLPLICKHGLLPPWVIQLRWRQPPSFGFDPEISTVLWDGSELIGVLLIRAGDPDCHVDARVVCVANRRLSSLGNLCLLNHSSEQYHGSGEGALVFRGDTVQHRETANLAQRMGGREMAAEYLFEKVID